MMALDGATPTVTPRNDYITKTRLGPAILNILQNESLFLLLIPIYMPEIIEIGPVIIKLLPNNNQYFTIQSRLHTTFSKLAVFTVTPPSR